MAKYQQMHKLRLGDVAAIILGIGAVGGCLYMNFGHPDMRRPSGFGPEWQCMERGIKGGDPAFCIKK
jgi:hypothetical protein